MSDLHLEFGVYDLSKTDADVIILAGDINVGSRALDWARFQTDKPVIYVLGNHEYCHHAYSDLQDRIREEAAGTNVHFLENNSAIIYGVRFLGCTLCSDFNLLETQQESMKHAEALMNDYGQIRPSNDKNVCDYQQMTF